MQPSSAAQHLLERLFKAEVPCSECPHRRFKPFVASPESTASREFMGGVRVSYMSGTDGEGNCLHHYDVDLRSSQ